MIAPLQVKGYSHAKINHYLILLTGCSSAQADLSDITLHQKTAITADPEQPLATGIAVHDGRISAVGDFGALSQQLHGTALSNKYADKILLPGFD